MSCSRGWGVGEPTRWRFVGRGGGRGSRFDGVGGLGYQ